MKPALPVSHRQATAWQPGYWSRVCTLGKPVLRICFTARRRCVAHAVDSTSSKGKDTIYLSDIIAFESQPDVAEPERAEGRAAPDAEELVNRATAALEAARAALQSSRDRAPSRPTFTYSSGQSDAGRSVPAEAASQEATRAVLGQALDGMDSQDVDWQAEVRPLALQEDRAGPVPAQSSSDEAGGSQGARPAWTDSMLSDSGPDDAWGPQPTLAQQPESARQLELEYAEPSAGFFDFLSQDAMDVAAARSRELPPLQSVAEMTTAFQPPTRGVAPAAASAAPSAAGRAMEDGTGVLADGTAWERVSGEERGKNGFWLRWTSLRGVSSSGKVEWEERWWEASDWAGMREMGAEKAGCRADGAAWRETWRETITFDPGNGEPMVERSAHKWAHDSKGDEWEEKWGEHYWSMGKAHKYADKWGKEGVNVWHERWGEDYDGLGGCTKWTDKWAERLLEGGGNEQWGDKWRENFKDGAGEKTGEWWTVDAGGHRYQRWWGEDHFGNGWVRKHGHSTTGEQWDVSEQMDTYYNPYPHFGYTLALKHSPQLRNVPTLPRGGDDLGDGVSSL
ncbi:hypothetical protein WJX81_004457 [Elliptochloris bilobata]|uniref:Uncharacterized protein n=1 Tax=Elliptochloris bilobata TaxID=381761 RepID=A0AAW1RBJ0_9CHLO